MSLLTTILTALAPHLIDMFIEIIRAEKNPGLDTGEKKHNHVLNKLCEKINDDTVFEKHHPRDIMDAANIKIRETVAKLNDADEFEDLFKKK